MPRIRFQHEARHRSASSRRFAPSAGRRHDGSPTLGRNAKSRAVPRPTAGWRGPAPEAGFRFPAPEAGYRPGSPTAGYRPGAPIV